MDWKKEGNREYTCEKLVFSNVFTISEWLKDRLWKVQREADERTPPRSGGCWLVGWQQWPAERCRWCDGAGVLSGVLLQDTRRGSVAVGTGGGGMLNISSDRGNLVGLPWQWGGQGAGGGYLRRQ